jgi:protein gp37
MGTNTSIEWCDKTFSPWEGCQKVGPGCDNCYAESRNARFGGGTAINWGAGAPRRRTSEANWKQPIKWNKDAEAKGIRYRVFCSSLADVFDNAVDPQWRLDLFKLIRLTPNLDWLLLTKRIGNVDKMLADTLSKLPIDSQCGMGQWNDHPIAQWPWPNVWIGATVVNQSEADRDIPKLLAIKAFKRFLSVEPMLGPINLKEIKKDCEDQIDCLAGDSWESLINTWVGSSEDWENEFLDFYDLGDMPSGLINPCIDWVICGGESGPKARPMHPYWVRSLRDQCQSAAVPFLFKQWGEWLAAKNEGDNFEFVDQSLKAHLGWWEAKALILDYEYTAFRVGKKSAGRILDGKEWTEFSK